MVLSPSLKKNHFVSLVQTNKNKKQKFSRVLQISDIFPYMALSPRLIAAA
jgi:hypothetical protein